MNNTFNINRFGLLLRRQWLDFGKIYLGTLIVLTGILIVAYLIFIPSTEKFTLNIRKSPDFDFRYLLFIFLGFLFTSIIASNYFNNLGKKADAIIELMTPASMFEKFASGIFYTSIVSTSCFLLIFYLVDSAFVTYFNGQISHMIVANSALKPAQTIVEEIFNDTKNLTYFKYNMVSPFAVASIFLLGSIYFKSFHYIKTATILILFTILWVSTTMYIMKLITDGTVWVGNSYWQVDNNIFQIFTSVGMIITITFYVTIYIRLKEKEV
ncbi:MAG: hypothetical protein EOO86_07090 [Pedobacter sp.]|nr:MAG: hypothetical protein EOO86_07090 [Pedobacter sp.]